MYKPIKFLQYLISLDVSIDDAMCAWMNGRNQKLSQFHTVQELMLENLVFNK